jgi:hypothetical protein
MAPWICQSCKESMPVETVVTVTKTLQDAANKLGPSVEEFETFLKTFATVVHENHLILLVKKTILIQMYGGIGVMISGIGLAHTEMSNDQCKRKRRLCEEVIKVLNKIRPGRNQDRGSMLFEYHLALRYMIKKNMVSSPVMKITYQTTSLKYVKEALTIFNDSPKGTLQSSIAGHIESNKLIAKYELELMMMRNFISK